MIEKIVLDHLKIVLDVDVFMQRPENPPKEYVIIEKTGGTKDNNINAATFAFQSYSSTLYKAAELNQRVKAAVESLTELDEIGRGTSTFDGLSIAWAVVEYIADREALGSKTLFATHYHELTTLEDKLSSVNNYSIAIKHDGNNLVFLRKIIRGGADRSYGIEVAELAGVPAVVTERAKEIAGFLSDEDITGRSRDIEVVVSHKDDSSTISKSGRKNASFDGQLSLFASTEEMNIASELKNMDLDNMTPVKALLYLQELKQRLN